MITIAQLRAIMPHSAGRAEVYLANINLTLTLFGITTPQRQAAFLAQIAHESGQLRYVRELASGDAYEYRVELGNVLPGDGQRYKGRGLIQITGRTNYKACGEALGTDFESHPDLLETPLMATKSAGWFWHSRQLNELADLDKFGAITKRINGGYNGLDDRISYWLRARREFGL